MPEAMPVIADVGGQPGSIKRAPINPAHLWMPRQDMVLQRVGTYSHKRQIFNVRAYLQIR